MSLNDIFIEIYDVGSLIKDNGERHFRSSFDPATDRCPNKRKNGARDGIANNGGEVRRPVRRAQNLGYFIYQLSKHLFLPRGDAPVRTDRSFDGEKELRFVIENSEHGPR